LSDQNTFDFELPVGIPGRDGKINRNGTMIRARAIDEIASQRDPRVISNRAFAPCVIFSRVITRLGNLKAENGEITPDVIGSMCLEDFKYTAGLYEKINEDGDLSVDVTCPNCSTKFKVNWGISNEAVPT
jgi:hypothetical protein